MGLFAKWLDFVSAKKQTLRPIFNSRSIFFLLWDFLVDRFARTSLSTSKIP